MMKSNQPAHADGPHRELFSSGKLSAEGHYKNGHRHETWKYYYLNGQIKAAGSYTLGEFTGYWEWWRENGQPLQHGSFSEGKQVGHWKRYYDNGQLWDEGEYTQAGKKTGLWITYNKDGTVKQQKNHKSKD
jgi:antitoxin component YwqK of YwqJK toxin-antitoxin module